MDTEHGYERNEGLLLSAHVCLTLPLPSKRLSPNGTRNRMERHRLAQEARTTAYLAARSLFPGADAPYFPPERTVTLHATVTLGKGDRRTDDDNMIARLKATLDGLQGVLVHDDRQIVWTGLTWERSAEPTRAGTIRLHLTGT